MQNQAIEKETSPSKEISNTQSLTIQNTPVNLTPKQEIERGQKAAKVLMEIVGQKPKPVIMNGEQYLEYEDWQTLGKFYGLTVKTGDAIPVDIDGVKGAKAQSTVFNSQGVIVGGAEAYCLRDEPKWNTRPKYEWIAGKKTKISDEPVPWFQLASMAQTRAGSKSLRNLLAWVAVLAGFRPTPAEEMDGVMPESHQTQNSAPSEAKPTKSVSEANKGLPATAKQKTMIKSLMSQKGFSTLTEAGINKIENPTMLDASMIIKKLMTMPKKEDDVIQEEYTRRGDKMGVSGIDEIQFDKAPQVPYQFPEGD